MIVSLIIGIISLLPGHQRCKYYYSQKLKDNVYTQFDKEPEFPGGVSAQARFLNKNLRYPKEMELNNELQSSFVFKLVIDKTGKILESKVIKKDLSASLNPLEKECIRVIKLMPRWTPAECSNKPVISEYKFPIACIKLESE